MSVLNDFDKELTKDTEDIKKSTELAKKPSDKKDADKKDTPIKDEEEEAKKPFAKDGQKKAEEAKGDSGDTGKIKKSTDKKEDSAVEKEVAPQEDTGSDKLQKSIDGLTELIEKSKDTNDNSEVIKGLATKEDLGKSIEIFAKAYSNIKGLHDEIMSSNEKVLKSISDINDKMVTPKKLSNTAVSKNKEAEEVTKSVATSETSGEGTPKENDTPVEKSLSYVDHPEVKTGVESTEKSVTDKKLETTEKGFGMSKKELISRFNLRMDSDMVSNDVSIADKNVIKSLASQMSYGHFDDKENMIAAVNYAKGEPLH